eukprot:CAMPEP_0194136428 /NCGR_PEP_ID=MMETSP0152-20130528/6441_1 /TAXON_ID=1049557 /ORGANISM="Thalassiothrix antarctica, Strain L6-D1" /LENGTH=125 /DNA_ID=CAMNT_0038833075 /DNA_START=26 /DNA_END=403 /DNA_ORIENTATION=-
MASRLLLRRSAIVTKVKSSMQRGGPSPPLPPFQRLPTARQPLVENNDVIFDDGVAPEMALDFDCQHISSSEALATWGGALFAVSMFYQLVKYSDPPGQNPAVNREMSIVHPIPKTGLDFLKKVEI